MKAEPSDYFEEASCCPVFDDYFVSQPEAKSKTATWGKYFFESLERGPVELVKKLLDFHAAFAQEYKLQPIEELYDCYGRTALIIAVMSGSIAKVKLVLDSVNVFSLKAYMSKVDQGDWSATVYADHLKFFEILAELKSREAISNSRMDLRTKRECFSVLDERGIVRKKPPCKFVPVLEIIPEAEKESEESDVG